MISLFAIFGVKQNPGGRMNDRACVLMGRLKIGALFSYVGI